MKKRLYSAVAFTFLAACVLLLAGCGSSSDSDTDIGFTDPGLWGTDGVTKTFKTVYDTTSASVIYNSTTYNEGSTAKSFITSYTISSVNYIGIMYCADYTSPTSFAIKLYFTVDTLPSTLADLGTIDLTTGHNLVIKVRNSGSKTFSGGAISSGTLTLAFSTGASKTPTVSTGSTTAINTVSINPTVTPSVSVAGGTLTGFQFTDLIPVPY